MKVAVVGASPKTERYSNRAIRLLMENGHDVVPVVPGHQTIEGLSVAPSLDTLGSGNVDTVTLYVNASRSTDMLDALKKLAPRRVIMNPGAENHELAHELQQAGIEVEEACTLVLLNSGQFE